MIASMTAAAGATISCSSAPKGPASDPSIPAPREEASAESASADAGSVAPESPQTNAELRAEIVTLKDKIAELETKLASLSEKVNFAQTGMEQMLRGGTAVQQLPSAARGAPVPVSRADSEVGISFVNDEPVQKYRDARLMLEAGRQTDAIVAFSAFLRDHADHALAGSAQYHIGRAYFDKGEYKLAREELQRVLVSYDRSSHVPETLALLSETEEKLNDPESSSRHRQLLVSLFPQSPAARSMMDAKRPGAVAPAAIPAEEPARTAVNSLPDSDLPDTGVPVTAPMDGKAEDESEASH